MSKKSTLLSRYALSMLASLGLVPGLFVAQTVFAIPTNPTALEHSQATKTLPDTANPRAELAREAAAERKTVANEKLTAVKLKLCKKEEVKITTTMNRVSEQGENQLAVFKKIEDRTKAFYEDKGYSVANYEAVAAKATTQYDSAVTVMNSLSATANDFNCESDSPKSALTAFRDAVKQKNEALNMYKTAVKNLIVAVKSAATAAAVENLEAR